VGCSKKGKIGVGERKIGKKETYKEKGGGALIKNYVKRG